MFFRVFVVDLLQDVLSPTCCVVVSFFMGFGVCGSDDKVCSDRVIRSNHVH